MFNYKGYYVWVSCLPGFAEQWHIQKGYDIIYTAKSIGQAKRWITLHINKG